MSETDARQTVAQRQCLSCKQQFDPTEGLTKCPHCELVLTPILTDPLINLVIDGQYKILEDIGHGAVSRVYKGLHLSLNTPIAIKVLKSTKEITPKQLQRFEIEGKAVRSLPNSNIARVYDYGVSPEPYIVMEYVNGKTLAKTISDHGAMPFEKAIPLFITIAEAIDQAHKAGLIHRDLKPSNIMVDAKSGEPKILDFGLVKGFLENVKLTTTGEMVGSPAYMSPEQCRGDRVDQRSDIYSLGCLMFETLTGTAPFDGGSTIEVIFKHLEGEIPDLQKTRPSMHCPPGLQQVLNRTLAKSAEDRYPDMSALCHDLRLVLSGKGKRVAARPRTTTKRGKILRLALAGATALAVALVAIVAMFLSFKQQTQSVVKAAPPLAGNTLKEGMENYLNAYCLKPDARFLFALSDVARYTDGKNVEEIKPVLKPDGWYITVGDDTMHLPRQPGYEELSSCLDEFTKRRVHAAQLKPGTETFTRPAVIDVSTLFDEAKLLENAYARQGMTGALAGAFARDLAWLGIIGYDTIGGLDHLQGRALALAAIAKQLNQNTADVDTLLAWDMGYELAAKRAASLLPKSNAVRAQIFDDKERLEVLASGPDPSGEAKYLRLLNEVALGPESKLFSTQPGQIWESQPAQDLAIAKLDARAKVHFSELLVSREILMESVNRAMQQSNHSRRGGGNGDYATNLKDFLNQVKEDHAGEKDVQPEWIGLSRTEQEMKTFETRLPETTKKFKHNRVLSDDIVRQYYTAFFYSSIFDILKTIEAWYPNDPNATKIFAKSLGKPNNKPGVGNKLNTLVQLKVSPLDPDKYAVFLSNGNTVGAPLLTQAFYQAMDNTNEEDRSRRWSASVDNRPQNLLTLGNIA